MFFRLGLMIDEKPCYLWLIAAMKIPETHAESLVQHDYLTFAVFAALFSILAFSRLYYTHFIIERVQAYVATRHLRQLIRRESGLYHPYSIITLFLFALSTSLVGFKALQLYFPSLLETRPDYVWFAWGTVGILVWVIVRAFLLKIVQMLIGFDFGQTENRYRMIVFNQVCAYALIPLVAVAYFVSQPLNQWLIWACLALLVLNYIYRLAQSVVGAVNYSANVLYLFLYLCTLEIVPLLVLAVWIYRSYEEGAKLM